MKLNASKGFKGAIREKETGFARRRQDSREGDGIREKETGFARRRQGGKEKNVNNPKMFLRMLQWTKYDTP